MKHLCSKLDDLPRFYRHTGDKRWPYTSCVLHKIRQFHKKYVSSYDPAIARVKKHVGGENMEAFLEFLAHMENQQHRCRTAQILTWVTKRFSHLTPKIAWNQPMFTDHGTFIIGFSVAKNHLAVAPERAGILHFSREIVEAGYPHGKNLLRIPWDSSVDFPLLEKIICFNILEKTTCSTFWRKSETQ